MTRLRATVILAVLVLLLTGLIFWVRFLFTPLVTDEQGYQYTVQPGATLKSVGDDLYFKNIIKDRVLFYLLVHLRRHGCHLKAGEYLFPKGTTPSTLLKQILTGSGLVYHKFTIVPGWSFRQLCAAMLQESHFHHLLQDLSGQALMKRLGSSVQDPEGQFYPDTYYFVGGSSDVSLLKRAFQAMQEKLEAAWQGREAGLPLDTSYQALIIASLIEKETEYDVERPVIAGVIINRLRKKMLLQIDPTVIYGMGTRFDGTIHKKDLLENTRYNTYVHKGVPPTPIAVPGLESLMAVMHPQHHDYLYFVAKHGKDGPHQFSRTLAEHYVAVAASRKARQSFFNNALIRYYLLKLFADQVMQFPLVSHY
jgi:UPF0755 protein